MKTLFLICIAILIGCSISSETDGKTKKINWEDLARDLRNGKNIQITNAIIDSDINLLEAGLPQMIGENIYETLIRGEITFINCSINGNIISYIKGHYSRFSGSIRLINCHINGNINMDNTRIDGNLDLSQSIVHHHTSFVGSRVLGNILFEKSKFAGDINAGNLQVDGILNVFGSEIGGMANFQRARLNNAFQASNVIWNGYCDFSQIRVNGGAYFNYGVFNEKVTFNNGFYKDRLEFVDCKFSKELPAFKICTFLLPVITSENQENPLDFIQSCNL